MATREKGKYPRVGLLSDDQRIRVVKDIFRTIPSRYDFLNRLLSLGQDASWRRSASRRAHFFRTYRFLDVGTGTCDLAIETAMGHPEIQTVGADFVEEMLELGAKKVKARKLENRIHLLKADAMKLPFPDAAFDVVGIAFGIRNIPQRIHALREMLRVLVPGGRSLILETSFPQSRLLQKVYPVYLKGLLPRLAALFSPNPDAYNYLKDSIMDFPSPAGFAGLMEKAGFQNVTRHSLTFGITCLYSGHKPENAGEAPL